MTQNISITPDEIAQIRALDDFDLKMFLSEVSDHGWRVGRELLPFIQNASEAKRARGS